MINNFRTFSAPHLFGLLLPLFIGAIFIFSGIKATQKRKRTISILFVYLLILVRGSRYIMDVYYGRFDIFDILSLQICHIDLILLIICLLKPNKILFHFTFLIGIPMGLVVALMPGKIHPVPGLSRAILFIMSHMFLIVGAVYLAVVEKMKLKLSYMLYIFGIGNLSIFLIFFINKALRTNFLYIMYAPEGTVIAKLDALFGWPGYVLAMDIIAMSVIAFIYFVHKLVIKYQLSINSNTTPSCLIVRK